MAALGTFQSLLRAVVHGWEAVQVELRGQYSLARYDELRRFSEATNVISAFRVGIMTPLSCLALTLVMNSIPLRPPDTSLANQSCTYWIFTFASGIVTTSNAILQFSYSSPLLSRPMMKISVATCVVGAGMTLCSALIQLIIGFPTPFLTQMSAIPWLAMLFLSIWLMWKEAIQTQPEVRRSLMQYIPVFGSQCTMIVLYPFMIYLFSTLSGLHQTFFSLSLPFVKIMFKNLTNLGVYHLEDFAATYIVLSVDVFHMLFVACAMQSATTLGTVIAVMSVDIFQSCIALVEICGVLRAAR